MVAPTIPEAHGVSSGLRQFTALISYVEMASPVAIRPTPAWPGWAILFVGYNLIDYFLQRNRVTRSSADTDTFPNFVAVLFYMSSNTSSLDFSLARRCYFLSVGNLLIGFGRTLRVRIGI